MEPEGHQLHYKGRGGDDGEAAFSLESDTVVLIDDKYDLTFISGLGYAIGHYARWITPGETVRLEVATDHPLVRVSAFLDRKRSRRAIVILNNDGQPHEIVVRLAGGKFAGHIAGEQSTESAYWRGLASFPPESADRPSASDAGLVLFDSHVVSREMVRMRDGVRLAADIYRPARSDVAAEGRFPVLVYRTPYNKAGIGRDASFFARHGYVVVAQDCRGRFDSEGEFYPFVNEGPDGFDTIEWAATQPWSNGKVGTIGGSYLAWDQYFASMYRPPHLEAMFAIVGGADFYHEFGHPGGVPNLGWALWILASAASSPPALRNPAAAEPLVKPGRTPGCSGHGRQVCREGQP